MNNIYNLHHCIEISFVVYRLYNITLYKYQRVVPQASHIQSIQIHDCTKYTDVDTIAISTIVRRVQLVPVIVIPPFSSVFHRILGPLSPVMI